MARLSREHTLSPEYLDKQLETAANEIAGIHAKILEMIADPSIDLDVDDLGVLAKSALAVRESSDGLHRLLSAFVGRMQAAAKPPKSSKATEKTAA